MLCRWNRAAMFAGLLLAAQGLSGCRTYIDQNVSLPGTPFSINQYALGWIILFFALIGPVATLVALYYLYFFRRKYRVAGVDSIIELYTAKRKIPVLHTDAILVPVAPDLKMVFGIAKMARDYGADAVQYEANKVAPLPPGEAFIGTGARYRFTFTVLAVIFDEFKRTNPELITRGVRSAMQAARDKGARSILFPDMTENLLAQPTWITDEQRQNTAETTARAMIDAIVASQGTVRVVRIWVWDPNNAAIFRRELEKLQHREQVPQAYACDINHTLLSIVDADTIDVKGDALLQTADASAVSGQISPTHLPDALYSGADTPALAQSLPPVDRQAGSLGAGGAEAFTATPALLGEAILGERNGNANSKNVIHLITRAPGIPTEPATLADAIQSGLALADEQHFTTLLVPNLGAGVSDYPPASAAPLIVDAIAGYLRYANSNIQRIFLIATDPLEREAFVEAIGNYQPLPLPTPAFPAGQEH